MDEVSYLLDNASLDSKSEESGGEEVYWYLWRPANAAADFVVLGEAAALDCPSDSNRSDVPSFRSGVDFFPGGAEMELEDAGKNKQLATKLGVPVSIIAGVIFPGSWRLLGGASNY